MTIRENRITTAALMRFSLMAVALIALLVTQSTNPTAAGAQGNNPPAAPTSLSAADIQWNQVELSWDQPTDTSLTRYEILRRDTVNQNPGVFTSLGEIPAPATSYTDSSVDESTRYAYRIKARNAHGLSPWSNYVNATTPARPPEPTPEPQEPENEQTDDYPADTTTPAVVGGGALRSGVLGIIETAGDQDWIRFDADGNSRYRIMINAYGKDGHTAADRPIFKIIYLSDGTTVQSNYPMKDGGVVSAWWTDDLYFVVEASGVGSYIVTAVLDAQGEIDDLPADATTSGYLSTTGGSPAIIYGKLTNQDTDWYRVIINGGKRFQLNVNHTTGGTGRYSPTIALIDSSGNPVADTTTGKSISLTPCQTGGGPYYAVVQENDEIESGEYSYALIISDRPSHGWPMAGTLTNSTEIDLNWSCFDRADSHRIDLQEGSSWRELGSYGLDTTSAKIDSLPDDVDQYVVRITAVLDGQDRSSRSITIIRKPDAPTGLQATWHIPARNPHNTRISWDAVTGANKPYETQIFDHLNDVWVRLESSPTAPHVNTQTDGKTGLILSEISPRYLDATERPNNDVIDFRVRARTASKDTPSEWSELVIQHPQRRAPTPAIANSTMTGPASAWLNLEYPAFGGRGCRDTYLRRHVQVALLQEDEWVLLRTENDEGPYYQRDGTQVTVAGLDESKNSHSFQVRQYGVESGCSIDRGIISPWSATHTVSTVLDRPGQPSAEVTAAGAATVRWKTVTGAYRYQVRSWENNSWVVRPSTSPASAFFRDLPTDQYWYIFEVRALGRSNLQVSQWSPNVARFNSFRTD